jgi:hypothetical protein
LHRVNSFRQKVSLDMARGRSKGESGPATLGSSARAKVCLVVWCKACGHKAELDPAEQAARHGEATPLRDWAARLRCSACGVGEVDFVVSGARR